MLVCRRQRDRVARGLGGDRLGGGRERVDDLVDPALQPLGAPGAVGERLSVCEQAIGGLADPAGSAGGEGVDAAARLVEVVGGRALGAAQQAVGVLLGGDAHLQRALLSVLVGSRADRGGVALGGLEHLADAVGQRDGELLGGRDAGGIVVVGHGVSAPAGSYQRATTVCRCFEVWR